MLFLVILNKHQTIKHYQFWTISSWDEIRENLRSRSVDSLPLKVQHPLKVSKTLCLMI